MTRTTRHADDDRDARLRRAAVSAEDSERLDRLESLRRAMARATTRLYAQDYYSDAPDYSDCGGVS